MSIRIAMITERDWQALKTIRLAALLDAPTAFGVSHAAAAAQGDEQWRQRAAAGSDGGTAFWLAFDDAADAADAADTAHGAPQAVGMIGAGVDGGGHFNLIGMWLAPASRGCGAAARLVDAVKARAVALGHARVVLDVAPENARAARFYANQGFAFLDEWEALASHPHIRVRKMAWPAPATA